jgi:hypothetical protein
VSKDKAEGKGNGAAAATTPGPVAAVTTTPGPVAAPAPELPIVPSVGLARVDGGWVVVMLHSQGDEILEREILNEDGKPMSQQSAHTLLRVAVAQRLILGYEIEGYSA